LPPRAVLVGGRGNDQIGSYTKLSAHKQIPASHRPRGFSSVSSEPIAYFKTMAVNGQT
jgi:hypothetical protein